VGVGRSAFTTSFSIGVGNSDDEDAVASVRRTDIGRSTAEPRSHVPERGQVPGDDVEPSSSKSSNVLDDHPSGPKNTNGVGDAVPEATAGPFSDAGSEAGVADVLTGEPGAQRVDRLDVAPLDGTDVAEVGDAETGFAHRGGGGVVLRDPAEVAADRQVEAAVAGAERTDRRHPAAPIWSVTSAASTP
jgi:hypothetical protein